MKMMENDVCFFFFIKRRSRFREAHCTPHVVYLKLHGGQRSKKKKKKEKRKKKPLTWVAARISSLDGFSLNTSRSLSPLK